MVQYTHLNPFPTNNLKSFSKKTNIEIIKTKTFTHISTLLQSHVHKNEHGFVIKLKRVRILDFVTYGCMLYTKITGMVIFGLVVYTLLLTFSYKLLLLLTFICQFYQHISKC